MNDFEELEGPRAGHGKWSAAGVPHRGWTCIDIEDLGAPGHICEMCERREVRFVHYMQHPEYPTVLGCGCVCAGHMEEDLAHARRREDLLRNTARRRRHWPSRKAWKQSSKGNWHISVDGYHVTAFRKGTSWSAVVSQPSTGHERFARQLYPTLVAAQLATFDYLIFLRTKKA